MKMHFTELNGREVENIDFLMRLEDVRLDQPLWEEWRAWVYVQDESLYQHLLKLDIPYNVLPRGRTVSFRRQATYDTASGKYFALPAHSYDNYLVEMAVYFWEAVVQANDLFRPVKQSRQPWRVYLKSRVKAAAKAIGDKGPVVVVER